MMGNLKNILVIGGSYTGLALAKQLSTSLPASFRVILIEPHSHFNHLFALPRFAVASGDEHKAFIPYTSVFANATEPDKHLVVRARVQSLRPDHVTLDRDWAGSNRIGFDYAVVATGTRLPAPGTIPSDEKPVGVEYLRSYQNRVKEARRIVIVGGGAIGVQMATDIKEIYPDKEVTLVHSREKLMPSFHPKMDEILRSRLGELGVEVVTGSRAVMPKEDVGAGNKPETVELSLQNGRRIPADLVIPATGQIPNNQFVELSQLSEKGFIKVRPTLQFQGEEYSRVFAAGDIADSGAQKAAKPGIAQAGVVTKNILSLISGQDPQGHAEIISNRIHVTMGLKMNMVFRNPETKDGETEPTVIPRDE
ncbi:related to Amid-like NADH oxidoreductase [Cephalotrichum gorgonifer]|uniref:Related to Amid-like NADH oxidoreductase n=1 Tax=Cephalotrichum gorgonifer TaxID=2041049 RepID=A0AAE8MW45_9PEZI|nr:related to Amid-like NADH oxidoreductase [Cephalotrichum gorgonifer]